MIRKQVEEKKVKEIKKYWNSISKKELDVELFWDPKLNSVPTSFEITRSNRIFLNQSYKIKELIPAIAHEHVHRTQFNRYGWIIYSLLNKFGFNSLDYFAKRAEKKAKKIIHIAA
jgi:hypothetical protein